MIESALSSSHFYYLVFLESEQFKNIDDVSSIFKGAQEKQKISVGKDGTSFFHLQVEIGRSLGSESVLSFNASRVDNGINYFWYDFYVGQITANRNQFVLCYPYVKLGKYIDDRLNDLRTKRKVLKPSVEKVLNYMKHNEEVNNKTKEEDDGLLIEITKYSAAVKDDSISRVNIAGSNPLNSRVYELLSNDERIGIEPLSLKLNCSKDGGNLELSFDKLGNLRFWLKRNCEHILQNILNSSFQYFNQIDVLEDSSYISKLTLLEDE